jgi:hypothetical protein
MRAAVSALIGGRPGRGRPERLVQCARKRRRCHRRTVSGVTIRRGCLHHLLISRLKVRFLHGSPLNRGAATPPDSSFPHQSVGRPYGQPDCSIPPRLPAEPSPRPSDRQSSRLLSRIPGSGGPDRPFSTPRSSRSPQEGRPSCSGHSPWTCWSARAVGDRCACSAPSRSPVRSAQILIHRA